MTREVTKVLREANDITIVVHQKPDGDAIGSSVALREGLRQLGKTVRVVCVHRFPAIFQLIIGSQENETRLPTETDLIVLLDCGELHRTGYGKQLTQTAKTKRPIVVFDHHSRGDMHRIAAHYHYDESVAATAELVLQYLDRLRCRITPSMATALLMALYTDTGGFQHANTTSRALQTAGRLVRYGGNLAAISSAFIQTFSPTKKRLWGRILADVQISRLGIISTVISKNDLSQSAANYDDVAGLANLLSLVDEARAALVLIETDQGWRGVIRTRHAQVNVGRLAKFFGGKGQKKAAGFTATSEVFSGKIKR